MGMIALDRLHGHLADVLRRVDGGETVVVTENGRPVFDIVPHDSRRLGGLDLDSGAAFLAARGISRPFPHVADDFDTPLSDEDLLTPLD